MALAFYQEKINSCEKVGKIFDCLDFLDFGSNWGGGGGGGVGFAEGLPLWYFLRNLFFADRP